MVEEIIYIDKIEYLASLFGNFDENIKKIEKKYSVRITSHGDNVKIGGEKDNVDNAAQTVRCLIAAIDKGETINAQTIDSIINMVGDNDYESIVKVIDSTCICVTAKGKPIKPKTVGQKKYVEAIAKNIITFGVGPAGTGKTYLAVAQAVNDFRSKRVSRIILTRPAVEAGERLGFLPGDLQQKVDPYLRPLYDALGPENFQRCQERGDIEVAPLAYMRGRTLDDSFIILDEAQNTTCEQMKMFLTRLGFNSKMVITGDITQTDLPDGKRSGLKQAISILKGIDDIKIIHLTAKDVVRHRLVQEVINAYERNGG